MMPASRVRRQSQAQADAWADNREGKPSSSPLTSLAQAVDILQRLHHHNRNQHRQARWWAQADMLRRHARKLLTAAAGGEGDPSLPGAMRPAAGARPKISKKRADAPPRRETDDTALAHARARYLRAQLIPRAYLSFTQLVADQRFAPVGLVLLGVLAQVDAAAATLAPDNQLTPAPSVAAVAPAGEAALAKPLVPAMVAGRGDDDDVGVPVSRNEWLLAVSEGTVPAPGLRGETAAAAAAAAATAAAGIRGDLASSVVVEGDQLGHTSDGGNLRGASVDGNPPPAVVSKRKRTAKNRKAKDEFDVLFSTLERSRGGAEEGEEDERPRRKKKKDKKKGGGDEIDAIFGSLL